MALVHSVISCRPWKRKWGVAFMIVTCVLLYWCMTFLTNYHSARSEQLTLRTWDQALPSDRKGADVLTGKRNDDFRWFSDDNSTEIPYNDLQVENDDTGNSDDAIDPVDPFLLEQMLLYPKRKYTERVLILSPIHNVEKLLPHFADLLKSLTYPHHLISVALGEDNSADNTLTTAKHIGKDLEKHFHKVQILNFNITGGIDGDWNTIHDHDNQLVRRGHLARSRNRLLRSSLTVEDWVLWLDSDVRSVPPDIIQQLLSAQKDIVVPVCAMRDEETGGKRVYDKNTWRETEKSLKYQELIPSETLVLEGYGPSFRIWLSNLRNEGRVVPIDGVGGCTLLIRAKCHRKGLVFPNRVYSHHIETEGLAKLAKDMKFGVYGMPYVEVIHS